jgi:hypothetical protein
MHILLVRTLEVSSAHQAYCCTTGTQVHSRVLSHPGAKWLVFVSRVYRSVVPAFATPMMATLGIACGERGWKLYGSCWAAWAAAAAVDDAVNAAALPVADTHTAASCITRK